MVENEMWHVTSPMILIDVTAFLKESDSDSMYFFLQLVGSFLFPHRRKTDKHNKTQRLRSGE